MEDMQLIVWLLPIVFMLHDFEEIIFMKPWLNRNANYMEKKFPKLSKKLLPHFKNLSTSAFAIIVAEEFVLLSSISLIAYISKSYYLWFGVFMAFFLHLSMHISQWIFFRRYTPTIVTSFLASIYCIFSLKLIMALKLFTMREAVLWTGSGLLIIVGNIIIGHYLAEYFDRWLQRFEKGI